MGLKNFLYHEVGALKTALNLCCPRETKRVFLVTGKNSYESSGAKEKLDSLLKGYEVTRFSDFEGSPNLEDIEKGVKIFQEAALQYRKYDIVIAVGGGRVMDTAKAINILGLHALGSRAHICDGKKLYHDAGPLIAIPTTAGSGSEATHFAVIYVDGIKYSLAHKSMLPDFSVVDPELTHSLSPKITAESGMDALAQAIESYWSVNATPASLEHSHVALTTAMNSLEDAVNNPSPSSRKGMALASNAAGTAINEAKTTAPHAISYSMTAHFGIAHGQAVGITLPAILVYNSQITNENCNHPAGYEHTLLQMDTIARALKAKTPEEAAHNLTELMKRIGLKTKLSELGITTDADVDLIASQYNEQRGKNNPRKLYQIAAREILEQIR